MRFDQPLPQTDFIREWVIKHSHDGQEFEIRHPHTSSPSDSLRAYKEACMEVVKLEKEGHKTIMYHFISNHY